MKLFTFATSSVFLGSIIATTTPAAVIAQVDDVVNNVGVIAALRGQHGSGIEKRPLPPGSSVCTYAPNYACYPNTPAPGWPRCCNNKDTCAKEYGAGKTPPCQTKACAGTTAPPAGSWCLRAKQVCCSSSKKISNFGSFCTYYGFKQPRSFVVASFEEEMMMMQEEGMITADEYSIDCRTCGNGKCA